MYDLILKNGLVADGGRAKPYRADVCIQNGCVAKITRQLDETANTVLDVAGLVVAPGFIDIHSHSDACPLVDYPVESKLYQGITTEITGGLEAEPGVFFQPVGAARRRSVAERNL